MEVKETVFKNIKDAKLDQRIAYYLCEVCGKPTAHFYIDETGTYAFHDSCFGEFIDKHLDKFRLVTLENKK